MAIVIIWRNRTIDSILWSFICFRAKNTIVYLYWSN